MAEFESGGTSLATLDTRYVNVTGDTLTGTLTLAGAPTSNLHASTKLYVDEQLATTDTLAELGDVTLTGLSGNNLLQYDSSSSRWINRTLGAIADNRYVNTDGDTMTGTLVLPSLTLTGFSGALSASAGVVSAGTLSVANGGTGIASYTVGDLLYASGATTLSQLADVATGSVLVSGGVGVAPSWSVSPTITSLLAVSNDSGALGASGTAFSDLFLASGGVINWNAGNLTLTHTAGLLTSNGNFTVSKADPTITLTDTGDSNSATWDRSDTSALVSHKNTAQEGGVAYGLNYEQDTDRASLATTTLYDGNVAQTISFWVKVNQNKQDATYDTFMSKFGGGDTTRSWTFRYRDVGAGNNRIYAALRDSNLVYNPNDDYIITGSELNDGNWHHIVFSWDYSVGSFKLYKDTTLLADITTLDQTATQRATGTTNPVELGSENDWVGNTALLAEYDEWAIWQRQLTDAEVSDLYNSGNGFYITTSKTFSSTGTSMGTNLVGLWHMDENTGTTFADSSTSGITGTFQSTNPAWTTGHVAGDGTDYTVTYLSHQDGGAGIRGRVDLGNSLGDTYINGATTYLQIAGTNEWTLTAAGLYPSTNDGASIGISGNAVSDIFLASGAVINFNAGAETITHSANTLTFGGITLFDMATGILEMNDAVRFDTGVAMVAASYSIGRDADGTNQLHLNVPTGATFEWSVNDVAQMTLSASTLALPVSGSIISMNAGNVTLTHSANALNLTANSINLADLTSTAIVFNNGGADVDFRGESDDATDLFYFDAGADTGAGAIGFFSQTPQVQQATIVDADGTLADITTKFNTLLADLEGYGLLKTA